MSEFQRYSAKPRSILLQSTLGSGDTVRASVISSKTITTWVGMATGLRVRPVVIIALFDGAFVDRFGSRFVLIVDRLALTVIAGLTALLVFTEMIELCHIVLLGAISGGMVAFGRPATNSLVPDLVKREHLLTANSMVRLSDTTGQ